MKAKTIIKKIEENRECSIRTAELLKNALHREKLLEIGKSVRFRPLFCDFDIVNTGLLKGYEDFDETVYENIGTLEDLKSRFNVE